MEIHDGNHYTTTTSLIYYILGWTMRGKSWLFCH